MRTLQTKTFFSILALLLLFSFSNATKANTLFCPAHANTDYEKIYCQIKNSKYANFLPTEPDFKNNMPRIQYLILKPYAKKLEIKIDKPLKKSPPTASKKPSTPKPKRESSPIISNHKKEKTNHQSLEKCVIQPLHISCSNQTKFIRQLNKQIDDVNPKFLLENNKLALSDLTSNDTEQGQIESFLSQQYQKYLIKMNEIGLIESALTWDKFTQIFFLTQERGLSFKNRFETMYSILKRDRREGLMVRIQQPKTFNLSNCQPLGSSEILCFSSFGIGRFVRQ